MAEEIHNNDDVVAKYKRLLGLARTSLEANQATLAQKDQQITSLIVALEEEKLKSSKRSFVKEDENNLPRRLACRVDQDDCIWILIEYESGEDSWRSFPDELSLQDYVQRIPGIPLVCPSRCLSEDESRRIEDESRNKIDRIVEEFRRFKVRTEIARKQKEAENKQSILNVSTNPANPQSTVQHTEFQSLQRKASGTNFTSPSSQDEEVQRLVAQLNEKETKWRITYEKIAKENEQLKNKGGETVLATQWRQRYETCLREKEELQLKLKSYNALSEELGKTGRSAEQAYGELYEDYKELKRRVTAFDKTKHTSHHKSGGATPHHPRNGATPRAHVDIPFTPEDYHEHDFSATPLTSTSTSSSTTVTTTTNGSGMSEAKIVYVRHMVVQYLTCKEPEVKLHIETALIAMFRMSAEERHAIELRRKEESVDTLTTVTSFLGSIY